MIIVANELLDAFPAHRLIKHEGKLWELGVTLDEGHSNGDRRPFQYAYLPLTNPELEQSLMADGTKLAEGQEIEINLAAERWITEMSVRIAEGALVIIDYGTKRKSLRRLIESKEPCYAIRITSHMTIRSNLSESKT